jgi:hypothetical protein
MHQQPLPQSVGGRQRLLVKAAAADVGLLQPLDCTTNGLVLEAVAADEEEQVDLMKAEAEQVDHHHRLAETVAAVSVNGGSVVVSVTVTDPVVVLLIPGKTTTRRNSVFVAAGGERCATASSLPAPRRSAGTGSARSRPPGHPRDGRGLEDTHSLYNKW